MSTLTDLMRWVLQDRFDWACVILAAVFAAWLDRGAFRRRTKTYDAWWFFHLDASDAAARARRERA